MPKEFPSASYDAWKTTDPDDNSLGPEPGFCNECEQLHHNRRVWSPEVGYHRCQCTDCIDGRREFNHERENENDG